RRAAWLLDGGEPGREQPPPDQDLAPIYRAAGEHESASHQDLGGPGAGMWAISEQQAAKVLGEAAAEP
ncbi:MAG TPA: hypothetical protein VNG33_23710, partial [Polyangiaceae bacterium]|nr:hypothetical protein [Polyangiaceae bacterium]